MAKTSGSRCGGLYALAVTLSAAGCVQPAERIATSLTDYGLDATQAQCIGAQLERNLSTGQLQQLGRAARAYSDANTSPGRLALSDLVRVGSQINDIQVPIEVGKAASTCGVLADSLNAPDTF